MFSVLSCSRNLLDSNPNIKLRTNLGHSFKRHLMPNEAVLALTLTSFMYPSMVLQSGEPIQALPLFFKVGSLVSSRSFRTLSRLPI